MQAFVEKSATVPDIKIEVSTMSNDQAERAQDDHKLVFRKNLFFRKYAWRFETKGLNADDYAALEAQFFTDEEVEEHRERTMYTAKIHNTDRPHGTSVNGSRGRMTYGARWYNTILYFIDEQDATLARLMVNEQTKLHKAVVV